jgi:hypothetical protein
VLGEHALPVRSEVAGPTARNTLFLSWMISLTASATDEVGTSAMASTLLTSNHWRAMLPENAIKFTDSGEVLIKASAASDSFTVSVHDTGPGISEADQAKLFQEFQQADNSITRKKGVIRLRPARKRSGRRAARWSIRCPACSGDRRPPAGFSYSPAMKSANISWDEGTLDKFLANPANKLYGLVGAPRDSNELERLTPWLG